MRRIYFGRDVSKSAWCGAVVIVLTISALLIPSAGFVASAWSGKSLELLMVDEPGCRYCRMWDAQVGAGYTATREGRLAPLTRLRRHSARLKGLRPVIYTPTFILLSGGREVGRITGYPGPMYFWEELSALLKGQGSRE